MNYAELQQGFTEIAYLREAMGLLEWDSAVLMPEEAAERRGRQVACLEGVVYDRLQALSEKIDAVSDCPNQAWHRANMLEMRRQIGQVMMVPKDVQTRLIIAKQQCEMCWRSARANSDFTLVAEAFQEVLSLSREALAAKAEGLGISILDAAMEMYEPGLRSAEAEGLLEEHAGFIGDFLPEARSCAEARQREARLNWTMNLADQDRLCREVCHRMGFPRDAGRIDVSTHPFSAGYPTDARITIRFDEQQTFSALCATIHETGHALYEINLPAQWNTQPVGQSRGMLLHESQSLSMEMHAGKSVPFLQWLAEHVNTGYGQQVSPEALQAEAWNVKPSAIRVEADEVTYPLHVLLRFRLEKDLVSGALKTDDLPEAFRAGMKELLGVTITDDGQGCLQDIHWYAGIFGYFPCYALGAMAAAQLMRAAQTSDSMVFSSLKHGDFSPIREWMSRHVHALASSASSNDILKLTTGKPLECQSLQDHLRSRYAA